MAFARRLLATAGLAFGIALASPHVTATEPAQSAHLLQDKLDTLRAELADNPFRRAIHLESRNSADRLVGEVHAVIDYPFAMVSASLAAPDNWCDILLLHFNVKYCASSAGTRGSRLTVGLGKKYEQTSGEVHAIDFLFRPLAREAGYFAVELAAGKGPYGTRDYRFEIDAIPTTDGRTLLHLRYAYGFGLSGRLAMRGYLATVGRDKRGFTVTGQTADGEPIYIQGVRGAIERNTMRYCLAVEAYLAGSSALPAERREARLRYWFDSTEQYAHQLHEMSLEEYLASKRDARAGHRGG